jgi:hypothetical protein
VLCIVIAAALTWAAHSSVAIVLLVMSLAYSHFVTTDAALALVLGANLGSAINPLLEGGVRGDPAFATSGCGDLRAILPAMRLTSASHQVSLLVLILPAASTIWCQASSNFPSSA